MQVEGALLAMNDADIDRPLGDPHAGEDRVKTLHNFGTRTTATKDYSTCLPPVRLQTSTMAETEAKAEADTGAEMSHDRQLGQVESVFHCAAESGHNTGDMRVCTGAPAGSDGMIDLQDECGCGEGGVDDRVQLDTDVVRDDGAVQA